MLDKIINERFKRRKERDSGESSQAIGIRTQNLGHMNVNNYLCVQMADTEMLPCDFRFQLG